MNVSIPPTGLKEKLEAERAKQLSENPESLGVRGWMGKGLDAEHMAKVAAEVEEREAGRVRVEGGKRRGDIETIGAWRDTNKAQGETTGPQPETEITEETMAEVEQRKGAQKKARPIPEDITNRWIWTARRAELEEVLRERFGAADADISRMELIELRSMLGAKMKGKNPPGPRALNRSGVERARSARGNGKRKAEKKRQPGVQEPPADNGSAHPAGDIPGTVSNPLSLYCMRCGFHMEVHQPEEFFKRPVKGKGGEG